MSAEQTVEIAARLYAARRTVRWIAGEQYFERLAPWMALLRGDPTSTPLDTCLWLCAKIEADGGNAIATLWLLAAAVELLEPSGEVT